MEIEKADANITRDFFQKPIGTSLQEVGSHIQSSLSVELLISGRTLRATKKDPQLYLLNNVVYSSLGDSNTQLRLIS